MATTALGALAARPEPAAARSVQADFIVVGAGFAGLGAAWELFKRGQRVLVLEASERVGGRIWSANLSDGSLFEIGGQWVSDAQTDIRTLMNELGVGDRIYKTSDTGLTVFVGSDGEVSRFDQHAANPLDALPPIDTAAQLEVALTFGTLQLMSSVVNVDAPWEDRPFPEIPGLLGPKTTAQADQWTIEAWMELNVVTDDAKAVLRGALSGQTGVDIGAISLLHELFVLQTFGGNFLNLAGSGPGQAEQFRVAPPGASQISDIIVDRLGPGAVRVGEPVKLIRQHQRGVTVTTTTGLVAEAGRVIVTAPGALDTFIRFDPILPPDRAQLQQRVPQGSVWKIWLVYDRAFWREQGLSGDTISIRPGDFIPNSRDGGPPEAQLTPGLMICFVVAGSARAFNAMTREERRAQVLKEMVYRYGDQAAQLSPTIRFPAVPPQNPVPDNYFEFNWTLEEWARGDFAAVPGPGVLTGVGFGPAIRAPFGRVHWAGVDTSTGPNYSSFSSAVQSGKRAAAEALAAG
jgi:monoamine oxidase